MSKFWTESSSSQGESFSEPNEALKGLDTGGIDLQFDGIHADTRNPMSESASQLQKKHLKRSNAGLFQRGIHLRTHPGKHEGKWLTWHTDSRANMYTSGFSKCIAVFLGLYCISNAVWSFVNTATSPHADDANQDKEAMYAFGQDAAFHNAYMNLGFCILCGIQVIFKTYDTCIMYGRKEATRKTKFYYNAAIKKGDNVKALKLGNKLEDCVQKQAEAPFSKRALCDVISPSCNTIFGLVSYLEIKGTDDAYNSDSNSTPPFGCYILMIGGVCALAIQCMDNKDAMSSVAEALDEDIHNLLGTDTQGSVLAEVIGGEGEKTSSGDIAKLFEFVFQVAAGVVFLPSVSSSDSAGRAVLLLYFVALAYSEIRQAQGNTINFLDEGRVRADQAATGLANAAGNVATSCLFGRKMYSGSVFS